MGDRSLCLGFHKRRQQMRISTSHLLGMAVVAAVATGSAFAASDPRDPYENSSSTWTRNTQAQSARGVERAALPTQSTAADRVEHRAARTITVDGRQHWISVRHLESVRLVDARGQSFVWQAGAPTSVALKAIAPVAFDSGDVWLAVSHPRDHVAK
jgi:hypothetical protein